MTVLTTPDHQREYLTVAEVAAELACSEPTVRRRIRAGEIPAVRLGGQGSGVRVPRAGLEAWLWAGGEESRRAEVNGTKKPDPNTVYQVWQGTALAEPNVTLAKGVGANGSPRD